MTLILAALLVLLVLLIWLVLHLLDHLRFEQQDRKYWEGKALYLEQKLLRIDRIAETAQIRLKSCSSKSTGTETCTSSGTRPAS